MADTRCCAWWLLHKASILGRVVERHTRSSSSRDKSRSLFLFLILVIAENPNSHRYEVENCNRIRKAFWAIDGYSCETNIQNESKLSSACFSFSVLSFETLTSSSSSFRLNCPGLESTSAKGLLTQSYQLTGTGGKYLLKLSNRVQVVYNQWQNALVICFSYILKHIKISGWQMFFPNY